MTEAAIYFLNTLRNYTAPYHKSIEQLPLSSLLLSQEVTLHNYRYYLIVLYGIVKEFEINIFPRIQHVLDDIESRRKSELLCKDLQSLGIEPENIITIDPTFFKNIHTIAAAFGCMYVIEGSTLGGRLICKHLEKVLGASVTGSLNYLKAYSDKTGSMWKKFLDTFCELAVRNHHQAEAIKSSIETFQILEKWMVEESKNVLQSKI